MTEGGGVLNKVRNCVTSFLKDPFLVVFGDGDSEKRFACGTFGGVVIFSVALCPMPQIF